VSGSFKVLAVSHLTPCLQCRVAARRDGRERAPARDGSPPASDEGVSDSALCDADERVEEDTGTDPHPLDGDVGRAGQSLSSTAPAPAPAPPSLESSARLLLTKLDHLRSRLETRESQRGFPSVRWRARHEQDEDEDSIEEIRSRAFPTIRPVSLSRPATAAPHLDSLSAQHDAAASDEPATAPQTVAPMPPSRLVDHDRAEPSSRPSVTAPSSQQSASLAQEQPQTKGAQEFGRAQASMPSAAKVESPSRTNDPAPSVAVAAAAAATMPASKPEPKTEATEALRESSASARPKLVLTTPSLSSATLKSRESISAIAPTETTSSAPHVQAIKEESEAPGTSQATATATATATVVASSAACGQTPSKPGSAAVPGAAAPKPSAAALPASSAAAAQAPPAQLAAPAPASAPSAVSGQPREPLSRPAPATAPSAHPPVMPARPPPLSVPRSPGGSVSAGPLTPAIMSRPASAARALLPGASAEGAQSADVVLAAMQILSSLPALKRPGSSVGPHPMRPTSAAAPVAAAASAVVTAAAPPAQPAPHPPTSAPAPALPSMARPTSARPPSGTIRATVSQGLKAARSTESVSRIQACMLGRLVGHNVSSAHLVFYMSMYLLLDIDFYICSFSFSFLDRLSRRPRAEARLIST
jgi:hypothetical protein